MSEDVKVRHDPGQSRYVLEVDGAVHGHADYTEQGEQRLFTHTEVDQDLEGRGLGARLVKEALEDVRRSGKRLVPLCAFVNAYVERHPEWRDLIDAPAS